MEDGPPPPPHVVQRKPGSGVEAGTQTKDAFERGYTSVESRPCKLITWVYPGKGPIGQGSR